MRWHVRPWGRLLFSVCLALAVGAGVMAQEQPKNQPKASDAEFKDARKVEAVRSSKNIRRANCARSSHNSSPIRSAT